MGSIKTNSGGAGLILKLEEIREFNMSTTSKGDQTVAIDIPSWSASGKKFFEFPIFQQLGLLDSDQKVIVPFKISLQRISFGNSIYPYLVNTDKENYLGETGSMLRDVMVSASALIGNWFKFYVPTNTTTSGEDVKLSVRYSITKL